MKRKLTYSAMISVAALGLVGCGAFSDGVSDTALIPPSANYQANYIPLQPPTMYPTPSGNMLPPITQEDYTIKPQKVTTIVVDTPETPVMPQAEPKPKLQTSKPSSQDQLESDPIIPNSPMLTPNNIIELNAVGMGVAPETSISPSQALALAKRAAIVDAYRQIGEKMYGIRVNGQDTVKDMMLQNSVVKTKVQALIRNAEITETVYKDGLCQVSMELKLDGKVWHKVLTGNF